MIRFLFILFFFSANLTAKEINLENFYLELEIRADEKKIQIQVAQVF